MKLIRPDHRRRIEIAGVPEPVRRPVDIDQSQTEFKSLRTLRIYRFDPGAVIDGHAEEDEVFIVCLGGSAELTMSAKDAVLGPVLLNAIDDSDSDCAAYLPPNAAYRLVPRTECDVAYARATPVGTRSLQTFARSSSAASSGVSVVLDVPAYAEILSIRLLRVDASRGDVVVTPVNQSGAQQEWLVNLRRVEPRGTAMMIPDPGVPQFSVESWDTVAGTDGHPKIQIAAGSSAEILVVLADNAKNASL